MVGILIVYLLIPVYQIIVYMGLQFELMPIDAVNYVFSISAYYWMMGNILIASKLPVLDRFISYDKRIRLHIFSSAGITVAVAYHGLYKILMGYSLDPVSLLLLMGFACLILTSVLWIPLPGFQTFRRFVIRRIRNNVEKDYDRTKTLHSWLVLAIGGLIFFHIAGAGVFTETPLVSSLLYLLVYLAAMGIFLYSRYMRKPVSARILSTAANEDILVIEGETEKEISYLPGQFAFLGMKNDKGKWIEHPFSFLSSNIRDSSVQRQKQVVSFAIKMVGDFTRDLSLLKSGDQLRIRGAFGRFRPEQEEKACLIGSGIGIVPILSILRGLKKDSDTMELLVFLAVNRQEEIPEKDEILKISEEMPGVQINLLVYQEDGILFSYDYFKRTLPDPKDFHYYICSSPGVRKILLGILKRFGISGKAIHFEAFSFG